MPSVAAPARIAPHHNLRAILARRGFRRLLGVRLVSQLGDGWFQAGLASSVFFNPEQAASPLAITSAFAVLLLPYTVLGPFIGVFLDRWSRRNALFLANLFRAAMVIPAAISVWYGREDPLFLVAALGVIALNRFFLAGLSASLPHVVDQERLVTANSFATTAGSVLYAASLASAGAAFHWLGTSLHSYAVVAGCAVIGYALAAVMTLASFRVDALGPDDAERPTTTVAGALMDSARGLVAGLRHLSHRPAAATVLIMQAGHRALFGVLTITTLLLYRNYYSVDDAAGAITNLLPIAAAAAAGSLLAAVVTPPLSRRITGWRTLVILTALLAVLVPVLSIPYVKMLTVAAAFAVSVGSQATKIVTDTTLQVDIADDYRGRVFSVNDTGFNFMFVVGLFIGALVTPADGQAPAVMLGAGIGYAVLALWFGLSHRRIPPTPAI
jgi:MFS family permease